MSLLINEVLSSSVLVLSRGTVWLASKAPNFCWVVMVMDVVACMLSTLLGCGVELETIGVTVLESKELTEFCTTWLDFFVGDTMLVAVVVATLVIMVVLGFATMVFLNMWLEALPVVVTGVLTGLTIAVE